MLNSLDKEYSVYVRRQTDRRRYVRHFVPLDKTATIFVVFRQPRVVNATARVIVLSVEEIKLTCT